MPIFQQNSKAAHNSVWCSVSFLGDRIVGRSLLPPHTPDWYLRNFHLWGELQDKVYSINPCTADELKRRHS